MTGCAPVSPHDETPVFAPCNAAAQTPYVSLLRQNQFSQLGRLQAVNGPVVHDRDRLLPLQQGITAQADLLLG